MIKFRKIFLVTAGMFALSAYAASESKTLPVVASDFEVKLSAFSHFQAGHRTQSKLKSDEKNVSNSQKSFAFYNDSALVADVSNKKDDIKYGAKIVLVPTAKRKGAPSYNGSHIYMESSFGKVEAGSPISASSNMMVNYSSIMAAGGDWDRYVNFASKELKQGTNLGPTFATFDEFFLDSKLVTTLDNRVYSNEPARRVSFYTPKFEFGNATKVQLGISYTPDSANTGADSHKKNSSGMDVRNIGIEEDQAKNIAGIDRFEIDRTVKNALSGGVVLEQNLSDGCDLKVGLTGEYGQAAGKAKKFVKKEDANPKEYSLSNLRTYNIGAVLTMGNFSCAASYGSLGKSLTTEEFHKTGRNTDYYGGSLGYKQGPFAASVSYFRSNQFKNTLDSLTVGTSYQLAPGFKPYVSVSGFSLKGKPEFFSDLKDKKTRGAVALIGAKLSF